jgi:hypothetical protein
MPSNVNIDKTLWRKSKIVQKSSTELAKQLPSRDMLVVDCMNAKAPPKTSDMDVLPRGANKYSQIGKDGAIKVLKTCIVDASSLA